MGKPVEKKKKKKGRPSLLDLQKRSLRLQKQQQQEQQKRNPNPSPTPNPYLRFPNPTSSRRTTRRNPNPVEEDDDDDEEDSSGKRREKKLKLVLRLPNRSANSPGGASDLASSGSDSDGDEEASRKKRKIDAMGSDGPAHGDRGKTGRQNSGSKATEPLPGEPSDSGPTTPLPDKKLLVFILDRLQKKDTYGVFSEPVDPGELPDYHDIIEHPMDFGTVRKKLSGGAYASLEQFERDVFLIGSNAMRYNSSDTIYYRQARSIHELAKKNFENLRQESDDNEPEPEPKIVRRGRPPIKATIHRMLGRPSSERTGSDFSSDATLANAGDGNHWSNLTAHDSLRKGSSAFDKPSTAFHGQQNSETYGWNSDHRSERTEEYSGSGLKGVPMRNRKKVSVIDENRRNTYKPAQLSACVWDSPVFSTFQGEKKLLIPVGVHVEHAYARSLARFAANLGPAGWEIAAKQIQSALPRGTKFGPGWVVDKEGPQQSQPPLLSTTSPPPQSSSLQRTILPCSTVRDEKLSERKEPLSSSNLAPEEGHNSTTPMLSRSSDSVDGGTVSDRGLNYESGSNMLTGCGVRPKSPFQICQNPATMQPPINGFKAPFGFNNLPSQFGKVARPATMTHARALDMMSRSNTTTCTTTTTTTTTNNNNNNNGSFQQAPTTQLDVDKLKSVGNPSSLNSSGSLLNSSHDYSRGQWRGLSLNPKPGAIPPDLNVGFQAPGSPVSGVMAADSQQPDLALQL